MELSTAVVTGAAGFIGRSVTQELLKNGIKVYAIDVSNESLLTFEKNKNLIFLPGGNYLDLTGEIKDPIDLFYHFAFEGGFESQSLKDYTLQLKNTKLVCDAVSFAISLKSRKFILSSTVNELEVKKYLNQDYFEPRFTCIYSAGKVAAEIMGKTLAFQNDMDFVAGLIAMPFGKGNHSKTLPNVIIDNLITQKESKLIEGNNKYDLVYIDDVAKAFLAIGKFGHNMKSYYIGHRELRTFREWVTDIRDILAPEVSLKFGEYPDNLDMDYSQIDLDALYNDTGFECKSDFRESILKTAEWIKTLEW